MLGMLALSQIERLLIDFVENQETDLPSGNI